MHAHIRRFSELIAVAGISIVLTLMATGLLSPPGGNNFHSQPVTARAALAALEEGNIRFIQSHRTLSVDTTHDADDRRVLAKGQHPFAAVLTCSDSRICPDFLFDQRLGSIFEIRNAGNVVDDDVMGSIEYAVEHFNVPLILVLGHTRCGGIEAVHNADGKPLEAHLSSLQQHMSGWSEENHRTRNDHSHECLDRLALENARIQAEILIEQSEPVKHALVQKKAELYYGLYDVESGRVDLHKAKLANQAIGI